MNNIKTIAVIAGLSLASSAMAKEGPDQYNAGAEGFMAGALPPAGTYFINYAGYFSGELQDDDGNTVPDVKVEAAFDALRFLHVTETKILGADYAVHMVLPLVHQKITTPGGSATASGLGDMVISPLVLGWHYPEWHFVAAFDIDLPTGRWDTDKPLERIGANYISYEPIFATTYLNESGFEASVKMMYNIKEENDDTNYKSGDEFRVDYTVAKHADDWSYGLGGCYLEQTTDDEQNGVKLASSKGRGFSIGPQIQYNYKGQSFIAKWQHDTIAENRFQGDKIHFKYVMRF